MVLRGVALLIAAAALCGCQTERRGLDYATAMQRIGPPKAGHARIVVFREKGFGGVADAGWEFALDGAVLKGLKTGTYLYVDRPAGPHQFFAAEPGFPGETRQDISVQSGRTYFYLARNSDRKNAVIANASTGLLGYGLTLAMTAAYKNPGPVDFSPVDEAAARTTVAELKLAE
ncbi:hypothetical protein [Bradyrhizobium sp. CCH5-F6]|jgi:hypothetical protein|uniref:hypothetical protein n=1 Tax=Bradyrhizobium sp. CCH5-F6 TaxID=1768753 RepID=UPI000769CC5B|nr:hypothetical protein [Bradyrhizobium sp. CCH5-F6]